MKVDSGICLRSERGGRLGDLDGLVEDLVGGGNWKLAEVAGKIKMRIRIMMAMLSSQLIPTSLVRGSMLLLLSS